MRALNLVSQPLGTPSGGLPVRIGKLLWWFSGSGCLRKCAENGEQEGVDFVVKVRCINYGQSKIGGVKSRDAYGAKKEVLIKREVYLLI